MQSPTTKNGISDLVALDWVSGSIWCIGSLLGKTWRYSLEGTENINPFVDRNKAVMYCFWHSHILPLAYIFRNVGVTAIVSASKDGDRATAVAQRWKHETIRGSSSKNQVSVIRQCSRVLHDNRGIVIIPDGPHGPREMVKPGAAMIALMTNAPVYPVFALPQKAWRLNSWDRFMVQKPFSRITVRFGEPLKPGDFATGENRVERFSGQLQKAMTL
jgi:lysophospholipid acyltransferase (LPLAT)-like uncharacterized protein